MTDIKMKSIWYFVGLILISMGIIIALNGIYQLSSPPEKQTVLSELHPGIWWGTIMAVFGSAMYFASKNESA